MFDLRSMCACLQALPEPLLMQHRWHRSLLVVNSAGGCRAKQSFGAVSAPDDLIVARSCLQVHANPIQKAYQLTSSSLGGIAAPVRQLKNVLHAVRK